MEELGLFSPGDEVEVDYVRNGHSNVVKVKLLNSQGDTKIIYRKWGMLNEEWGILGGI